MMLKEKKSAFTLIEMIIVISLIVIVIGITSSIFITGNKIFSDSDVNTTLQMEGQRVQEKISDIGMQAIDIESVKGDSLTGEISNIVINSYDKDGNWHQFKIEFEKEDKKISIDGNEISRNVESIKINKDIINNGADESRLEKFNSIQFDIILSKNQGFSQGATYPVNFTVTFRNKS